MLSMLSKLCLSKKEQYGSKASALGELIKSGVQVPKGFALSSEFFCKFLKYNGFNYNTRDYLACNKEIYDFVLNSEFSYEMETNLQNFLDKIKSEKFQGKYVVRSSALCEDNDNYSMAGMFSSFINLNSFEEIKNSIKKCYASLFDDKVISYFLNNNLNFEDLKMGVIIQQFVVGDYSGVIFSVDTIDMDKSKMHINIVKGLCDNYVSGKEVSAFYAISKQTGQILEERIPDKFDNPSKKLLDRLSNITLEIERIFCKYQDIEWTVNNNEIYILQARPVTTFKINDFQLTWEKEDDSQYIWYREDNKPYEPLINELNLMQGEALNEGFYAAGFQDFYSEYCVQNGYFFYRDKEINNQQLQERNFSTMLHELHSNYKDIFYDVVLPELLIIKKNLDNYAFRELSPKETLDFFQKSIEHMKFLALNHWPVTHSCDYIDIFMEYCRSIDNELIVDDFYDLIFNISILNKEREFYINMANEVMLNPILNRMFKYCKYDELLYARLKKVPEGKNLLRLINNYMIEFGICILDSDTNSPYVEALFKEKPSKVIGHLRGFLNINIEKFRSSIDDSLRNKEIVKFRMLSKLDKVKKEDFLNRLRLAEKAYLARDEHHYYFERMTKSYLRLALMEVEKMLLRNNEIQHYDDMYFLTVDEIKEGILEFIDFNDIVNKRRQLFLYQKKLLAPPTIGKEIIEDKESYEERNERDNSDLNKHNVIINGLSGLRKKVKGKVKLGIPDYLEEDYILVVPYTRCGQLENIINHVKGIIVEVGSPFEHLGILTREMDIPVIYNVKNAMTIFKDEDKVEIDGYRGEVKFYA